MSFKSIIHPTDFSDESKTAFNHALRLAVHEKSKFILMYSMPVEKKTLDWNKFPKVRDTLYKWNLIDKEASRTDIQKKLGVKVQKVIGTGENIVESVVGLLPQEEVDLIVLSTHGREGLSRILHPSISESISRKALVPTLFFPLNCKSFVSEKNGDINLKEILVPIDHNPKPQRAVEFAINMGKIYGNGKSRINIMHVLESRAPWSEKEMPEIDLPENEDCILRFEYKKESIDNEIMRVADEVNADLIVMATEGHTGFLDVLYGSTSEQVLRNSSCPILTVPVAHGKYFPRYY